MGCSNDHYQYYSLFLLLNDYYILSYFIIVAIIITVTVIIIVIIISGNLNLYSLHPVFNFTASLSFQETNSSAISYLFCC